MYRLLPRLTLISLLLLPATQANAETENPLLISADDRCAFERVDNESLPLAIDTCLGAAADGDMKAQYELGQLYYSGDRVEQNYDTALQWLEQASIQGEPRAQYRLGMMHFKGEGVRRNLPQAYIILKMASINGHDAAMDSADLVALQMNQQEMNAATHVLGTLFRDYLAQIREEQLNGTLKMEEPLVRPDSNAQEIEELLE
ncbi:MAG: tetratricopeptide repeat protein [Halopseudomonas sabulinigri]|jgi:TPR repeat protein|tara:strand:- start:92 stop:697 length:606 start_codon:yes stop_codon:yes gene_type:complete